VKITEQGGSGLGAANRSDTGPTRRPQQQQAAQRPGGADPPRSTDDETGEGI